MRKIVISVVAFVMALSLLPTAYAVKFGDTANVPKSYWNTFTAYEKALQDGDPSVIAATGMKVIEYWLNGATAEQCAAKWQADVVNYGYEINSVWSVSNSVSKQYETLGDIENALRAYKISLAFVDAYKALTPHIGGNPDDMEFARTELKNKIAAYDVSVDLYAEIRGNSGDTSFHNAKFEPKTGLYFGEPAGASFITTSPKKPSSTLIYVLFENEDMEERVAHDLSENEKLGYSLSDYSAIQIAWNFKEEGLSLGGVPSQGDKVTAAAKYLASLDVPVLLRVGAEMNVWEKAADPEAFKTAFKFIADIMRREAPNVALVWSVNNVSAKGLTYDMFYPGDAYVDWVGISLYTARYFLGNPGTNDAEAAIYGTGIYANPVAFIKELVAQYGSRKPIMISEGAVSLRNNSNAEDLTAWAKPRMRLTYAYIPMLFPEVKAMYWFNVNVGEAMRWDFSVSAEAKELYGTLTSSEYFIGKGGINSPVTYKKLGTVEMPSNAVTLLTYAPFFTMDNITIHYRLDGNWMGQSSDIPYRQSFNMSDIAEGQHKLSVIVYAGETQLKSTDYNLSKNGSFVTISAGTSAGTPAPTPAPATTVSASPTASAVLVNGVKIDFDAYNINGNNYFKLRDLAYVLNGTQKSFEISWDGEQNLITITTGKAYTAVGGEMTGKGSETVTVSPTSSKILLNGAEVTLLAYNIGGNNYFKLRDIGEALDFGVDWNEVNGTVEIDSGKGYSP